INIFSCLLKLQVAAATPEPQRQSGQIGEIVVLAVRKNIRVRGYIRRPVQVVLRFVEQRDFTAAHLLGNACSKIKSAAVGPQWADAFVGYRSSVVCPAAAGYEALDLPFPADADHITVAKVEVEAVFSRRARPHCLGEILYNVLQPVVVLEFEIR